LDVSRKKQSCQREIPEVDELGAGEVVLVVVVVAVVVELVRRDVDDVTPINTHIAYL